MPRLAVSLDDAATDQAAHRHFTEAAIIGRRLELQRAPLLVTNIFMHAPVLPQAR